jgi:hypothetical protein
MANVVVSGKVVLFDEADRPLIESHSWWLNPQGYACTKVKRPDGTRRTIGMHRLILGDPTVPAIDHINRNRLDNTRENLRATTDSENNRNRPTAKNKSSKYRGVSFRKGRWDVVIRVDGKLRWFGAHDSEHAAAKIAAPYFADVAP